MLTKKNVLTFGKKLKADQAARNGNQQEAHALFSNVCKLDPTDTEAWVKLSLIEKGLGNFPQAERCARRSLMLEPQLGYGHYALGQALHSQRLRAGAIKSYLRAISLIPDFPDAYYLLGLALHEEGAISEAVASLTRALELRPLFAEVLAELGAICIEREEIEAGLDYLQRASALRPFDAVILNNISLALRFQGKEPEALDNFRKALRLAPDNVDLIAGMAKLQEKVGNIEEAEVLLAQGLSLDPDHVAGNLVAAQLDRRGRRLQKAVDRLEHILAPTLPDDLGADVALELGQIYDEMGDAMRAYPRMVEGKRKKAMATFGNDGELHASSAFLTRLEKIRQLATPALAIQLQSQLRLLGESNTGFSTPVFLIGFPRSGTTLMEQILDSHPRIQALEEKSTVSQLVNRALDMLDERDCALTDLQEAELAGLRQLYFTEVSKHIVMQPGSLLIDKMPLNTVDIPVIVKVFPNAKFILAIRHPCDVILSCLMQNFASNASMAHFFTIEDTAQLYAQVMGAFLHYADFLPLNYHRIRYEDLIEDVPAESRKMLDFLGLPWDDTVLNHTAHARQRGGINTPSYHQVVQPIYQRSKYRWKRYAQELTEVLPALQPFIKKFGYE